MEKQYTIIRAGNGSGPDDVPELTMDQVLWEPDCGIRAGGRIFHDGENLLVLLRAKEKDIRAEYTAPMSPVHEDSCLEFFFMPAGEEKYLNFEINPNGCLHIGFGRDRYDRERILLRLSGSGPAVPLTDGKRSIGFQANSCAAFIRNSGSREP